MYIHENHHNMQWYTHSHFNRFRLNLKMNSFGYSCLLVWLPIIISKEFQTLLMTKAEMLHILTWKSTLLNVGELTFDSIYRELDWKSLRLMQSIEGGKAEGKRLSLICQALSAFHAEGPTITLASSPPIGGPGEPLPSQWSRTDLDGPKFQHGISGKK